MSDKEVVVLDGIDSDLDSDTSFTTASTFPQTRKKTGSTYASKYKSSKSKNSTTTPKTKIRRKAAMAAEQSFRNQLVNLKEVSPTPLASKSPEMISSIPKVLIKISELQKINEVNFNMLETLLETASVRSLLKDELTTSKEILGNLRESAIRAANILATSKAQNETLSGTEEIIAKSSDLFSEMIDNKIQQLFRDMSSDLLSGFGAMYNEIKKQHETMNNLMDNLVTKDNMNKMAEDIKSDIVGSLNEQISILKQDMQVQLPTAGKEAKTINELILDRKIEDISDVQIINSLKEATSDILHEARILPSGKIKVVCSDKALSSITNNPTIQDTMVISEVGPEKTKVIVYNLEDNLSDERILKDLTTDSKESMEHYKVLKSIKHKKLSLVHKVILVPMVHAKSLIERTRVSINLKWHQVKRYIPFVRCMNCQMIGHSHQRCTFNTVCAICTLKHKTSTCNSQEEYCYNCHEFNTTKIRNQPFLNIYHRTSSRVCPYIAENIKRIQYFRSSTDFVTPIFRKRNILLDIIQPNPFYFDPNDEGRNAPVDDTDKILALAQVKSVQPPSSSTSDKHQILSTTASPAINSNTQRSLTSKDQHQSNPAKDLGSQHSKTSTLSNSNRNNSGAINNSDYERRRRSYYDYSSSSRHVSSGGNNPGSGDTRQVRYRGSYSPLATEEYI